MKPDEILHTASARDAIGRPVAYYPSFTRVLGIKCALFVCQFLYWEGKEANNERWIFKTSDDIVRETGLSYEEQRSVRKHLREIGLLDEKLCRVPAQLHYRFKWEVLDALLTKVDSQFSGKPRTRVQENPKLESRKTQNWSPTLAQTSMVVRPKLECGEPSNLYTETSAKITAETSAEIIGAASNAAGAKPGETPTNALTLEPVLGIEPTLSSSTLRPTGKKPEVGRTQAGVPDEIRLVHSVLLRLPPKDLWPTIVRAVRGKNEEHVRTVYEAWRTRDYSPMNFGWLEWLTAGIPPPTPSYRRQQRNEMHKESKALRVLTQREQRDEAQRNGDTN